MSVRLGTHTPSIVEQLTYRHLLAELSVAASSLRNRPPARHSRRSKRACVARASSFGHFLRFLRRALRVEPVVNHGDESRKRTAHLARPGTRLRMALKAEG